MSIQTKIAAIMKAVKFIEKDGRVKFGNTDYAYMSEEKITTKIRGEMTKNGIIMYPIETEFQLDNGGKMTTVVQTFRIQDIDDNSYIDVKCGGQGVDSADKGIAKAMTMCFKYVQRQAFMIPTGDDPDKHASAELVAEEKIVRADDIMTLGKKHSNMTWKQVLDKDRQYLEYLAKQNVSGYGAAINKFLAENPVTPA